MINYYLHKLSWADFDKYKDDIIKYCLDNEKPNIIELNIASTHKHGMWESKFDFLENTDNHAITQLKLWIITSCEAFLAELNETYRRVVINDSWAHVTRNGGYHLPHAHCNSTWSGILYVTEGDANMGGKTHWIPPMHIERKPGLEFLRDDFFFTPEAGSMMIFPSALIHYVDTYHGASPRITIAFNSNCF